MHIAKVMNHGKPYLQVMESYTVIEDGKRKNKKRTIRSIGPLARFDDGKPDFMGRLRTSFKAGKPIIDGLNDLVSGAPAPCRIRIEFDKDDDAAAFSEPKNVGYFVPDNLYDKLGIYDVVNKHKSNSAFGYDLNGLTKLLVFGRFLSPESKCATWRTRNRYVFNVAKTDREKEIFLALDELDALCGKIQKRMNRKITDGIGRNMAICYYDVTNYRFEIDQGDEDILDSEGNIAKKGLRKTGVSKAKNRKPIVQMGLFIDDNGIPVSYRLFPGSDTDQTTLRPAMKSTIDKMGFSRVIVVADGGLNTGPNIAHILKSGGGYIVSKSTKKSDRDVKAWILEEDGYEWLDKEKRSFKYKSFIRERTITDEDKNPVKIKEKIVCYWSRKHYRHEVRENKKFVEYLEAVLANPDKLKDKQKKIQKYIKKTHADKHTGEVVDTVTLLDLDMDKIKRDLALMGYYTVMTSEVDMPDLEVVDKYHGLSRIEESFRVIKSDLEGRPVHVWKDEHVNAHFLTCFIALTMMRIIQHKILSHQNKATGNVRGWECGLSAVRIKNALGGFMADALPGGYFRLTKQNEDLKLIMDAIGVDAGIRIPTIHELRQLKYTIDGANIM
jgi:transposase